MSPLVMLIRNCDAISSVPAKAVNIKSISMFLLVCSIHYPCSASQHMDFILSYAPSPNTKS